MPLDAGAALELGQQRAQRVAAVQLVGAVGDDEAQRLGVGAAHEEGEEVARRGVGPVGVLEHEHDRPALAEPVDERQQRLEQARLVAALALGRGSSPLVAQLGQQLGERGARLRAQPSGNSVRHSARSRAIGRSASTSGA